MVLLEYRLVGKVLAGFVFDGFLFIIEHIKPIRYFGSEGTDPFLF